MRFINLPSSTLSIQEELTRILDSDGEKKALSKVQSYPTECQGLAYMTLAEILFNQGNYKNAFECYQLVTKDQPLYQKAQYQLGSIIFNQFTSNNYNSPREHARHAIRFYVEAGNLQDAPDIIKKLQEFLNEYQSVNLTINGLLNQSTLRAIRQFQLTNKDEVLKPWGLSEATGNFYLTTRRKANIEYCRLCLYPH